MKRGRALYSTLRNIFILAALAIPAAVLAAEPVIFTGEVTAAGVNLRTDATVSSEVICVLSKGDLLEVVKEAYDWYKVRLPKEAPSYLKKEFLECNNIASDLDVHPGRCLSATVKAERLNVRLKPDKSSWILGKADNLLVLNVVSEEGDWYRIEPIYRSYGWINKKFLVRREEPPEKKEDLSPAPALDAPRAPAPDVTSPQPEGQTVVEGRVVPYGVVLWRKATHKLVTSAGKVYLLCGDRRGLNRLNYHKVRVTGKLTSGQEKSAIPLLKVDIIEDTD